jgi:hypothetical protein
MIHHAEFDVVAFWKKSIGVGLVLGIFASSCKTGEEAIYLLRQYFATLFDRVDYQVICRTPDLGESFAQLVCLVEVC